MSKSVSSNFHCEYCDVNIQSKEDFERHCKGRKHQSNQHLAHEQEAAKRTIYVRGIHGIPQQQKYLLNCFSCFGKVNKVTVKGNKNGGNYALVEMQDLETAAKALKKKTQKFGGFSVYVSQYRYRPPKWEMYRMLHKQTEVEAKEKLTQIHKDEITVLSSAESLTGQISLLAERLRLTPEDEKIRFEICQDLTSILSPYFEDCAVHQFGSSVNRFGAKGCDLDLFLDLQQSSNKEGATVKKKSIALPHHKDIKTVKNDYGPLTAEHVSKIGLYDQVKLLARILTCRSTNYIDTMTIPSQRCPVVKFSHKHTGIKCDLSLNNRKALHNSLLHRLYGGDPRVHKLVSVVRLWARSHELAGGVGANQLLTNYALTLIIMFFLMSRKPRIIPLVCDIEDCVKGVQKEVVDDWECLVIPSDAILPPSDNTETEVDLVKAFFKFYAETVDWNRDVLLTKNGTFFPKGQVSQDPAFIGSKTSFMTVMDPFVLTHNVTGNVNEKTKDKFMAEVKRAVELTSDWPNCNAGSDSEPWGVAALLMPDPNENSPNKNSKKAAKKGEGTAEAKEASMVEGQLDNGEFCIALQPTASVMAKKELISGATQNNVSPAQQWCSLAQYMVLEILETVFKVEVKEGEKDEEKEGSSEVKVNERNDKNGMEVDEGEIKNKPNETLVEISKSSLNESGSVVVSQKGDNLASQIDKVIVEGEVMEPLSGKRTRQEALLDVSNDESISTVPAFSESNSVEQGHQQSPGKRICERPVSPQLKGDQSMPLLKDNSSCKTDDSLPKLNSEINIPNEGKTPSSFGLEFPEDNNKEQKCSNPVRSDSKTSMDESSNSHLYTCVCEHWLWIGRKKLRQHIPHNTLEGLALEQEISRLALRNLEKKAREEDQVKKDPPAGPSSQVTVSQKSKEKEDLTIRFLCSFQHRSLDAQIPHILVKMKPDPNCANQFKNLFCSLRSLVLRLVTSHLFDD